MVSALTSVADARAVGLCALALTRKERENAGLCVGASDVRVLVGGVKRGIACEETDRTRDTRETATGARVGAIPAASARGDIVGSGDMHEVSRVRDARSPPGDILEISKEPASDVNNEVAISGSLGS